jgi:probable F420-dependent oxidoreductase
VLVIPYRHPLVTAKTLATIDQLSGGRVILGAGVGWLREEFEALGTPPFEERGAVTDEYLRFMRATWTTDPVRFAGRYVSVQDVHALPKPAQPGGIPVWIGGHTDAAVRRAAVLGDGWHPIALRPPGLLFPPEYTTRARQLQAWAKEAGRDPAAITLSVRVPMEVRSRRATPPAGDRPFFQGTAEQVIADIEAYAAAGVTHFVFDPTTQDLRAVLDNLDRFAHEVRARLGARRANANGDGARRPGRARTNTASTKRSSQNDRRATPSRTPSRSGHPRSKPAARTAPGRSKRAR